MHPRIEKLSEEFLEFPLKVEVTPAATPVETVTQVLYQIPNLQTKLNMLRYLFKDEETFTRVILFTRSKRNAEKVAAFIDDSARGVVRVIHGNKGQNTRINAMDAFRSGEVRFLVATDAASRGIDISGVTHVINVDVPMIYEDYVHRIGRTGRAEQEGASITFATAAEMHHIREIEKIIKMQIPEAPLPPEVGVAATKFAESQEMAQEIDKQKRRADPTFKGAFHEKKPHFHEGMIDKRTGRPFEEKKPTKIRGFRRNKS